MHTRVSVPHILLAWYGMWWSLLAIAPFDRKDWALENALALAVVGTLIATHRRFRFSSLSYVLITLFMSLHAVGAHYTYAEVPLGFWLENVLSLSRNPFDRIVHFAFGFLLVYPLKELLMRTGRVDGFGRSTFPSAVSWHKAGFSSSLKHSSHKLSIQTSARHISERKGMNGMRKRIWLLHSRVPRS
jgi:putative membrane protein